MKVKFECGVKQIRNKREKLLFVFDRKKSNKEI